MFTPMNLVTFQAIQEANRLIGKRKRMPKQTLDWESWKAELIRIVGDGCGPGGPIAQCGEQCWRESYDDGQSPQEAWDGNLSYGDAE